MTVKYNELGTVVLRDLVRGTGLIASDHHGDGLTFSNGDTARGERLFAGARVVCDIVGNRARNVRRAPPKPAEPVTT